MGNVADPGLRQLKPNPVGGPITTFSVSLWQYVSTKGNLDFPITL